MTPGSLTEARLLRHQSATSRCRGCQLTTTIQNRSVDGTLKPYDAGDVDADDNNNDDDDFCYDDDDERDDVYNDGYDDVYDDAND